MYLNLCDYTTTAFIYQVITSRNCRISAQNNAGAAEKAAPDGAYIKYPGFIPCFLFPQFRSRLTMLYRKQTRFYYRFRRSVSGISAGRREVFPARASGCPWIFSCSALYSSRAYCVSVPAAHIPAARFVFGGSVSRRRQLS